MSLKIWILFMFGFVIYLRSSAQFCMRRYINDEWISEGDCRGQDMMSQIMNELQRISKDEKKKWLADKEWTVFQRRINGDLDFYRGWDDYVDGFGNREGDYWLGLQELHQRTKEGNMELEINMILKDGATRWLAKYSNFRVGPGFDNYRLTVSGYSGNATSDSFSAHNDEQFSTKGAHNDRGWLDSCVDLYQAGWWYGNCGDSNLNGNFNKSGSMGFWWDDGSSRRLLRYSEMKFRRRL